MNSGITFPFESNCTPSISSKARFELEAAAEASQGAVGADDPVAGKYKGKRVFRTALAGGSGTARGARSAGYGTIGADFSPRDIRERPEHLFMEGGHPAQVERGLIERDGLSLREGKEILPEFQNGFAGFPFRSGKPPANISAGSSLPGRAGRSRRSGDPAGLQTRLSQPPRSGS